MRFSRSFKMRLEILLSFALFGFVSCNPTSLRQKDAHSDFYEYGVTHPGGRSRVHVRTGNSNNPGKSYGNPHEGNPRYHLQNYEKKSKHTSHEGLDSIPVYVENSHRPVGEASSLHPSYGQKKYVMYPEGRSLSHETKFTEPFYEKPIDNYSSRSIHSDFSKPHLQHIIGDSHQSYDPAKIEQHSLKIPSYNSAPPIIPTGKVIPDISEPLVIQQTSDNIPINFEPIGYKHPSDHVSQLSLDASSSPTTPHDEQHILITPHIDQQSLKLSKKIGVPLKESQVILQEPDEPLHIIVSEKIPETKSTSVAPKVPLVQQEFIDTLPLQSDVKSEVKHNSGDIISQDVINSKSALIPNVDDFPPTEKIITLSEPEIIQKSIQNEKYNKDIIKPISQIIVKQHPSQAVYDSSIEPNFSDTDEYSPKHLIASKPNYLFVPVGEPYQKFSHSSEIVHPIPKYSQTPLSVETPPYLGRSSHFVKFSPHSQKQLHLHIPHTKNPPPLHFVKLPPHPQEQLHIDVPHEKNLPPAPHTVKIPPQPQKQLHLDILHTKNLPPPHSVKLPPHPQEQLHIDVPHTKNLHPAPHTIKILPQPPKQLHLDIPHTKNPAPPHSVKLPPHPQEQLHIDVPHTKNLPPAPHSVKIAPQPQEQLHLDIPHTKNLPSPHSVKIPPHSQKQLILDVPHTKNPPSPLPHSVKLLPHTQEQFLLGIPHTKNAPSPPHSVKLPPHTQEQLHLDIPHTKNPPPPPPHSIKLPSHTQEQLLLDIPHTKNPPPPPHSVKLPPHTQEQLHLDIPHTKNPPPPPPHSIELPPLTQEQLHLNIPHTKNPPPPPHSVKLPPHTQEQLHLDIPHTKNPPPPPPPHSIKLPSHTQEQLLLDIPHTKNPPPPLHSVKLPPLTQEQLHLDIPHTKNPPPPPHSVKLPPHTQEQLHLDIPHTKNPPSPPPPHSIKLPPHTQEQLLLDIPHTKNPPSPPHSVKLPLHPQEQLHIDAPHTKNPYPASHSVKLPPHSPKQLHLDIPHTKNPPLNSQPQEQLHLDIPHTKNPPAGFHLSGLYPVGTYEHQPLNLKDSSVPASPHFGVSQEDSHLNSHLKSGVSADSPPFSHGVEIPESNFKESSPEKSPFEKYPPVSHAIRLPIFPAMPKSLVPEVEGFKSNAPQKNLSSKVTTSVPNLFAAVPSSSVHDGLQSSESPVAKAQISEALIETPSPVSHSVRLNIPTVRTSNNFGTLPNAAAHEIDNSGKDFPAFPESALAQKDPVADKVSSLPKPQGYRATAGYIDNPNHEPDAESSNSPSTDEARLEVERISREIGVSFGSRISPSRF